MRRSERATAFHRAGGLTRRAVDAATDARDDSDRNGFSLLNCVDHGIAGPTEGYKTKLLDRTCARVAENSSRCSMYRSYGVILHRWIKAKPTETNLSDKKSDSSTVNYLIDI